jgi:hypothetical protein
MKATTHRVTDQGNSILNWAPVRIAGSEPGD